MLIKRFEDIQAWQEARKLTKIIYSFTNKGIFVKDWGLKDQIRRSSVSVGANISEGFDSKSKNDFIRFLSFASRSASEVQSHLYAALDLDYISQTEFSESYNQADLTKNLIGGFIRYLSGSGVTEAQKHRSTEAQEMNQTLTTDG